MVQKGFSLSDVQALYIDELVLYYAELIYVLEESGQVKEGTYEKVSLEINDDSIDKAFNFFKAKHKTKQ